jgi:hypothetical protein
MLTEVPLILRPIDSSSILKQTELDDVLNQFRVVDLAFDQAAFERFLGVIKQNRLVMEQVPTANFA